MDINVLRSVFLTFFLDQGCAEEGMNTMDQAILRRAHSAQTHIDSRLSSFPSPSPPICTLPTPISLPLTQLNRLSPVTDVGQPHSRSQFYIETCSLCLSLASSLTLLPLFHLFYMHFFPPSGPIPLY